MGLMRKCCKAVLRVLLSAFVGLAYADQMDRSPEAVLPSNVLKFLRGSWKTD